jgi:hypothetical protein
MIGMQETTTYQATTVTVDWTIPLLAVGVALLMLAVVGLVVVLWAARRRRNPQ